MNALTSDRVSGEGLLVGDGKGEEMVVEGVGNEVLVVSGSLLALTMFLVAMVVLSGRGSRVDLIHPEQVDPVQSTRREMGVREEGDNADMEHCPICLARLTYAVDTNCGHRFCAECVLTYWQHDQWPSPARCAVCRRPVSNFTLIPTQTSY